MKRWISVSVLVLVLLLCGLGAPWKLWSQATANYTKINTAPVATTTFTTGTLTAGAYNFEVTALSAAGLESGPSNIVTPIIPNDGKSHTVTLTWTASTGDMTYNVYDQVVAPANPPGALSFTVN
jgi:hypothetical protein